jgi:hypothetical protein
MNFNSFEARRFEQRFGVKKKQQKAQSLTGNREPVSILGPDPFLAFPVFTWLMPCAFRVVKGGQRCVLACAE